MKRMFDVAFSSFGILMVAPLLIIVALVIKLESKGPVLFKQERVGKDRKIFKIYKLRTMVENASALGPGLTRRNDPRITSVGRILRWLKIDELPQLVNVIKGDMSFVGPRPEIPTIVAHYSEKEKEILSVRPGIFGPSQIQWRHEAELYPEGTDTENYYRQIILPAKLQADLDYVRGRSCWKDVKLFFKGVYVTIIGSLRIRSIFQNKRVS